MKKKVESPQDLSKLICRCGSPYAVHARRTTGCQHFATADSLLNPKQREYMELLGFRLVDSIGHAQWERDMTKLGLYLAVTLEWGAEPDPGAILDLAVAQAQYQGDRARLAKLKAAMQ